MLDDRAQSRFWSKVAAGPSGCILWTGYKLRGYGQFGMADRPRFAHRLSYEMMRGEIPDGAQIDHLCRQTACVNPWHLEAVSQAENLRRSALATGVREGATHCPAMHPYDEANTMRDSNGWRKCRECLRHRNAVNYRKRKATA